MTGIEDWKYAGPAVLTVDGMEWPVQADLSTEVDRDPRNGFALKSWGGTLTAEDMGVLRALGVAAVITLPDGRQGTLYCGRHVYTEKTEFKTGTVAEEATTLEVTGSGPAPY